MQQARPNKSQPPTKKTQFVLQQHLVKNSYLDAKDMEGVWRLAKIMERDDKYLTIRFDAWEAKFQQQMYTGSTRLAPLRRHTQGYTGPYRRTARDSLLKLQAMSEIKQKLEQIIMQESPTMTAYQLTQFLRAELFVLVDSLLTFPCHLILTEVKAVANFLQSCVIFAARLCEKCLKLADEHFEEFIGYKQAYLINPYAALLASLQEVLYYLMLIFMIKGEQRNQLYNAIGSLSIQEFQGLLLEHLKNIFIKRQGLSILKKIFLFKDINGKGFPSSIRRSSLLILTHLSPNKGLGQIQMPTLEIKDYIEMYKLIPVYLQFFPKQQTQVTIVEYTVMLAIGNNSFDAKLRGINELKSYIDRLNSKDGRVMFKLMTEDKLVEILKQTNFLSAIVDPRNFNSQIFKRSISTLRLLAEKKVLTNVHISQIFKLAENRHESEVISLFGVISEMAGFVAPDGLDHMFGEILKFKMNEMTINLIKQFTIKAIDNLSRHTSFFGLIKRKKSSSKYEYYGVNLLWKEIQDEGSMDVKLIPVAQDALKAIFSSESIKGMRDTYLTCCLENIKKNKSFGQSMKLFLNILQSYNIQTPMLIGEGRGDVVQRLDKKYEILKASSIALRKCDFPKLTEQQCVSYFFEFLEEYNSNLKQGLKVENIKNLWRINDNQVQLLNFLRKPHHTEDKQYRRKIFKRLPHTLIKELFTEIFLMGEFMNNYFEISPLVYDTVDELFLAMHFQLKNIDVNDKNTIRLLNYPLMGIQFYENILLANRFGKTTTTVLNKAKKRYVQLYMRLKDYNNIQKKLKLWATILERLLEMLPKNRETILPTIHEFLIEIEGKMIRENVTQTGKAEIEVKCENKDKIIRLPRNSTILKLRRLISKEFNIEPSLNFSMEVCSSKKEVTFFEEEDFSVNAIEISSRGPTIKVSDIKGRHPHLYALQQFKQDISHNQKIYTMLVDLLSQPNVNEQEVWQVLELLPKNRNIFDKMENISNEFDSKQWRKFFAEPSLKKLSYKLKMMLELIHNPIWVSAFKATGGFDELSNRMTSFTQKDFASRDNIKCICLLLDAFFNCLSSTGISEKDLLMHLKPDIIFDKLKDYMNYPETPTLPLTNHILRLMLKLIHLNNDLVYLFYANKQSTEKLLTQGCFEQQQSENDVFIVNFTELFVRYTPVEHRIKAIELLIKNFISIEFLQQHPKCYQYFMLLISCLEKLTLQQLNQISENSMGLLKEFPGKVFSASLKEANEKDFNSIIYGALRTKTFLLWKQPASTNEQKAKDSELVNLLVKEYLFHESDLVASHIQSKKNTVELYKLLELLFKQDPNNIHLLAQMLIPRLQKAPWRKPSTLDWMIEVERQERKVYCGLRNLRATCYINCLLQQFYTIQPLREALMRLDCTGYNPNLKENEMYQLQKLLSFLKYSHKGAYNPRQFCEAFRDFEGKPIDVNVQSDVDEFFNAFVEKLQNLLKVTKTPQIIDNVFRGTLSNQLVCEGCPHSSQRQQQFLSLGVNIKNKSSLDQALKGFIEGEILDGDNAYYCETCKKKVRTLKRLCIKQLPNILIIVLKRFEFNYDSMKKIKVNDYCSFPQELDMKKFTAQHLKQNPNYMPNDYYDYKLRGVVVHYGSSEAGHYYSYIKDEKKQWHEFNDQLVTSFNPADLPEETFGGSETFGTSEYDTVKSEKCRNAYLLFYERDAFYDGKQQRTDKMIDLAQFEGNEKPIMDLALQDNSSFQFIKIVFEPAFVQFILTVLSNESDLEVYKMGFIYFHTVLLRARDKDDFVVPYCQRLEEILRNRKDVSEWYVNQMIRPFIRQFLIEAPKYIRYITVGLAKLAISQVEKIADNIIVALMNFIVNPTDRKNLTPYCRIFIDISQKDRERQFMQQLFYPQRVVAILTSDSSNKFQDLPVLNDNNDFGQMIQQKEKERGYRSNTCFIALIESLINFHDSVTIEDLELIQLQTNDKASRKALARMASGKLKRLDKQVTIKTINRIASKMLHGEDRDIRSYQFWFKEAIEINDELSALRLQLIIQKLLQLMEACESTYYPFDNLFIFMIKMCSKHPAYKAELKKKLEIGTNPSNQYLRLIETWIHKSGMASKLVYNDDWKAYKTKIAGSLPQSSFYYDEKRQVRQRQFDTIVKDLKQKQPPKEKERDNWFDRGHDKGPDKNIENDTTSNNDSQPAVTLGSDDDLVDRSLTTPFKPQDQPLYKIKTSSRTTQKVRVIGRAGMLYRVNADGVLRWYAGDREQFSFEFANSII